MTTVLHDPVKIWDGMAARNGFPAIPEIWVAVGVALHANGKHDVVLGRGESAAAAKDDAEKRLKDIEAQRG